MSIALIPSNYPFIPLRSNCVSHCQRPSSSTSSIYFPSVLVFSATSASVSSFSNRKNFVQSPTRSWWISVRCSLLTFRLVVAFHYLGLNDLIVLCVSIPMTLSTTLLEHWVFGEFLCKLLNFTPTLTALVSTFTVATIAVERWFFIVNKKKFDRRCTILTLILLWVVSIAIALPEFLSRHLQEFAPTMTFSPLQPESFGPPITNSSNFSTGLSSCYIQKIYFCVVNPGVHMRLFSYFVITVQYLVPFAFVSISCYSISRFLKNRMKYMRTYQLPRSTNDSLKKPAIKPPPPACRLSHLEETTELELTSHEETPTNVVANDNLSKSTNTSTPATKTAHRVHYQQTMVIGRESFRSSSIVGTFLMPNDKAQSHSKRRFHRSRKLLICVAALFTISWLPLTVVQIYLEHNEEITQNEPNFVYGFLLIPCYLISSLSAWMNPVIYNYINRSFRREFYALYPCCFRFSSSSLSSGATAEPTTNTELPSTMSRRVTRFEYSMPAARDDSTMLFTHSTQQKSGTANCLVLGSRKQWQEFSRTREWPDLVLCYRFDQRVFFFKK